MNKKLTFKQKILLSLIKENGEMSKSQIVDHCSDWYYANGDKHIGDVLSRMVSSNLIHRPKNGVYKAGPDPKKAVIPKVDPTTGQQSLF